MIWFDLDNSPHVPLFRPILLELSHRKIEYWITARDFAQTEKLLEFWGIPHLLIGKHGGGNKLMKISNLLVRSRQLQRAVGARAMRLAVSHGSRSQLLATRQLKIPSVLMLDYEYTESWIFNRFATYILMPTFIPEQRLANAGIDLKKVLRYNGFKEEIYLSDFVPDPGFRESIHVGDNTTLITIRPPSMVGNYHDRRSEQLYLKCLERFSSLSGTHCLIVNRTDAELALLPRGITSQANISILQHAVDGLQLIWSSDLVVSGGGTMNREAALLGVPTFSIFSGRKPYLDETLREMGKLVFINDEHDIENIPIRRCHKEHPYRPRNHELVCQITDLLVDLRTTTRS